MRIALVHTPPWTIASPPLNVTYLAAWLKKSGLEARVFDLNAELFHSVGWDLRDLWVRDHLLEWQADWAYGRVIRPQVVDNYIGGFVDRVLEYADMVGISVYSPVVAKHLARLLRERNPNLPIVAGGQCCEKDWYGMKLAESGLFDAVVFGEGEQTLLDLARIYSKFKRFEAVPGSLVPRNGEVIDGGPRTQIENLDVLPIPDYSDLDMRNYGLVSDREIIARGKVYSVLGSRGCVRSCDFCIQQTIWQNFRIRSPKHVDNELAWIQAQGAERVVFNDLLVNGNPKFLSELCDLLIARQNPLKLAGSAIITKRLTADYLRHMQAAGFYHLDFGIEHASKHVLAEMGKKYDEELIAENLKALKEVDMPFVSSWVVGHPAEKWPDFFQVLNLFYKYHGYFPKAPQFSLCAIHPGSDLYRKNEQYGVVMNGHDAIGWRLKDNSNTLEIRRERGRMFARYIEEYWGEKSVVVDDKATRRIEVVNKADRVAGRHEKRVVKGALDEGAARMEFQAALVEGVGEEDFSFNKTPASPDQPLSGAGISPQDRGEVQYLARYAAGQLVQVTASYQSLISEQGPLTQDHDQRAMALAAQLRDRLEKDMEPEYALAAEELKQRLDELGRQTRWSLLANPRLWDAAAAEESAAGRQALLVRNSGDFLAGADAAAAALVDRLNARFDWHLRAAVVSQGIAVAPFRMPMSGEQGASISKWITGVLPPSTPSRAAAAADEALRSAKRWLSPGRPELDSEAMARLTDETLDWLAAAAQAHGQGIIHTWQEQMAAMVDAQVGELNFAIMHEQQRRERARSSAHAALAELSPVLAELESLRDRLMALAGRMEAMDQTAPFPASGAPAKDHGEETGPAAAVA
ncbi:MAG: Ribosomal protein S12 methylthiotransferase RimO [Myxococcota bacterium]|nr:Ribosomal protein S12 methylthiotransferase RimO [Myxococcota bacterium]